MPIIFSWSDLVLKSFFLDLISFALGMADRLQARTGSGTTK